MMRLTKKSMVLQPCSLLFGVERSFIQKHLLAHDKSADSQEGNGVEMFQKLAHLFQYEISGMLKSGFSCQPQNHQL